MRQLFQDLRSGETLLLETPAPAAEPGRILVRVRASAISVGTERRIVDFSQSSLVGKALSRPDLVRQALRKLRREGPLAVWESARERLNQPMPLGYSCSGTVVELGEDVSGFAVGDNVACAGAGYANHAEFACVPENLCALLPPSGEPSFEQASLVTIGSISLQGLRLGRLQLGESVAVIGLGLLGQFALQLARTAGCRALGVDIDPARLGTAMRMGADSAVLREGAEDAARSFTNGKGFDVVLICADTATNDPVELAGDIAKDRGIVISVGAVGTTLPRDAYFRKELEFRVSRSYGPGRYDPLYEEGGIDYPYGYVRWTEKRNMEEIVRLMASGALRCGALITHRFAFDESVKAYQLIAGKTEERFLGVVLTYGAEAQARRKVVRSIEAAAPATVRVGVLGAGAFASSVMLPLIRRSGVELRGIASSSGVKAGAAANRFGFGFAASDQREVLNDAGTSVVAVITRHNLHASQTVAALKAGKHVFVEKPLCLTRQELKDIEEAKCAAEGRLVTVGFNRRFAPFSLELKDHFEGLSGPKMVLIRVNAGRLPPGHWVLDPAIGGGRLLGEGCHFIDWANFIIGSCPMKADCSALGRQAGGQDWALRLLYPDGSVSEIVYLSEGPDSLDKERYEVHAGGRSATLEDFRLLQLYSSKRMLARRSWLRSDKGHEAHWQAFCRAIEKGEAPPIPWQDIVDTMRAAFAAQESLSCGKAQELPG